MSRKGFTRVGSNESDIHKHSSLLPNGNLYGRKRFYSISHRGQFNKTGLCVLYTFEYQASVFVGAIRLDPSIIFVVCQELSPVAMLYPSMAILRLSITITFYLCL